MTAPAIAPRTVGDFTQQTVSVLLQQLADKGFCGTIHFEPSALKLRFLYGEIVGAAGGEPIGSILVRRGAITEAQLVHGIQGQGRRTLGQVLTGQPLNLEPELLVNALETQIKLAVNSLLSEPPMNYALLDETLEILEFSPRVAVQDALAEASSAAAEVEAGVLGPMGCLRAPQRTAQLRSRDAPLRDHAPEPRQRKRPAARVPCSGATLPDGLD
jgi:hypothetical protein